MLLRLADPNDYIVLEDGQHIGRIRSLRAIACDTTENWAVDASRSYFGGPE